VAGVGWKEGVVGTAILSVDLRSPAGRTFQTAEPVTIKDLREQEEYVHSELPAQREYSASPYHHSLITKTW
jgi:hypothetical protein